MSPTRLSHLLGLAAVVGLLGYLLAGELYLSAPSAYTAVPLGLLAVTELVMAKVVRDRVTRRRAGPGAPAARPLHPMQVARAAVLAKASSAGGAIVLGGYLGLLAWALPRRGELLAAGAAATVAALAALASLALVVAALVLERSCRAPDGPGGQQGPYPA